MESFRAMQQCFAENPEHYKVLSLHPCAREVTPSGARLQRPLPVVASEISCHLTHVCPVWARYRLNTRALDALQEFLEGPDEEEEEAPKSEEDKRKEAQEWHLHTFAK